MQPTLKSKFVRVLAYAGVLLSLTSCLSGKAPPITEGQAKVDYDLVLRPGSTTPDWEKDVRPVLDKRCVVCHACYDAPCQLKLTSFEGLSRGANPAKVYDGGRLKTAPPTRLFVDAGSTPDWRAKGFHPVMSDIPESGATALEDSVLYRLLRMKQRHPQPMTGMLPDELTTELDRAQVCTDSEGLDKYEEKQPLWGMPYGMPNLKPAEYRVLVEWLAAGAPAPEPPQPSAAAAAEVRRWETFLNGDTLKERLMSRYVYEHLFIGHLYFPDVSEREFFRLVRSRTPPGQPIQEIPTVRPMDDPGPGRVWYRLALEHQSVTAKDHTVYAWSPARMARYRSLFLTPDYRVESFPSYAPEVASNPLLTFEAIPVDSRYRFLLDDARYFIEGFIKGPVCRGQVALNVIEDQFWVFFFSPDHPVRADRDQFLSKEAGYLALPAEQPNSLNVFKIWTTYWDGQKRYMNAKQEWFKSIHAMDLERALDYVWDGGGTNPNAALTVFRHTDSAYVLDGLWGDYPETAWIIDFPLLERIHYLLVAGFDVYGNVGHQLSTRIVMDFLRMEGENHFLAFLPAEQRKTIRDSWYQGIRERRGKQFEQPLEWLNVQAVTGYQTTDVQRELYDRLIRHMGKLAGEDHIHRCKEQSCARGADEDAVTTAGLHKLTGIKGRQLLELPDASLLRVRNADGRRDSVYTLVVNKGYKNLTSFLQKEDRRSPDDDTLSIIPGFAVTYPNLFLVVDADDLDDFVQRLSTVADRDDYERFVALYGVRRTNPGFWEDADWFQASYRQLEPVEAGILDLNRYWNR